MKSFFEKLGLIIEFLLTYGFSFLILFAIGYVIVSIISLIF